MREGKNIQKDQTKKISTGPHRVIIPLYIPHEENYYKDSFDIFLLCLQSLRKTSKNELLISVCSNGSSDSVNEKLYHLYENKIINELFLERENIGKINSILKALRTAEERFITITDGDILFLNNWEQAVFDVFESFPKAAAVSPMPVFRTQNKYTSNIFFDYLFSKKIRFTTVQNPEALTIFAKSIGWPWLDLKWKDVIMTLENKNGKRAVLGCNHSVVTYKNEIFESLPKQNSQYVLGGTSEEEYLDKLNEFYDGYRLATNDNFAYHLGNSKESWMIEKYNSLYEESKFELIPAIQKLKKRNINYIIKSVFFKKIINLKVIKTRFYTSKGLDKQKLNNFI